MFHDEHIEALILIGTVLSNKTKKTTQIVSVRGN